MKKAILIIFTIFLILIPITSCSSTNSDISSGTYVMQIDDKIIEYAPKITLDTQDNTFTFSMDTSSSYIGVGTFTIDGNTLKAMTNDEVSNTYIFEIVDSNTLSLDVNNSSKLDIVDKNINDLTKDSDNIEFKK